MNNNYNPYIEGEVDIVEDGVRNLLVVESETWDVMSKMLNSEEPQMSIVLPTKKVIPFVKYDGHKIYKSTLVS